MMLTQAKLWLTNYTNAGLLLAGHDRDSQTSL